MSKVSEITCSRFIAIKTTKLQGKVDRKGSFTNSPILCTSHGYHSFTRHRPTDYSQQTLSHEFTLYFFDSHSYSTDSDKYAWILPSQINWYSLAANQTLTSQYSKGLQKKPLAMAFLHIP